MPSLRKLVLTALCVGACGVPPASSQFAPSENPIPRAVLQISYQSALNQWEFVDQFAMPYERMAVLLCAAPPSSTCDLSEITFSGTCDELSAHPVFAASAWRQVGAAPDACLRAPALNASMHAVPPNQLLLDNDFAALGQFDTVERGPDSANGTNSTRSIALRVRFVYLQALGSSAVRVYSAGYALTMSPLRDNLHAVHVQRECGARGFSAPGSHLPTSQGGATLQVHETLLLGRAERLCIWSCELPYIKMPWNAPALTAARPSATGRCVLTPESFTAVSLSFAVRFDANQSLRLDSQQMLLGIDRMAEDMTAALVPRFGDLSVLLSMRNSSVNPHEVNDITAWVRSFNARNNFDVAAQDNPDYNLQDVVPLRRRLLQDNSNGATTVVIIDGVVVAKRTDEAACCLGGAAVEAQQKLEPSAYDLDMGVSGLDKAQINSVVFVTQNNVYADKVVITASEETSSELSPWIFVLVVVVVLACFCMCQNGFETANRDDQNGCETEGDDEEQADNP